MPTRLTVTVDTNGVKDGETRRAEVVQAVEALERVAQALVSTHATSGTVTDRNGAATGSPQEIARMTPAQRLDYARLWDQSKMPEWRDPRAR